MHCNLRQPDTAQSLSALIRRTCQVWSRSAYALPYYRVFLLFPYVTMWPWTELWPPDIELRPLTFNICNRSAAPRSNSVPILSAIGQSAAELLQFEYLTLWSWTCIMCCAMLWDTLHNVQTESSYPFMKCNDFYDANTYYHLMTLTFDTLILKVSGTYHVTWS